MKILKYVWFYILVALLLLILLEAQAITNNKSDNLVSLKNLFILLNVRVSSRKSNKKEKECISKIRKLFFKTAKILVQSERIEQCNIWTPDKDLKIRIFLNKNLIQGRTFSDTKI